MASRRKVRLTERDLELLGFASEHRFLLAAHAQACLGVSAAGAYERLRSLAGAGFLKRDRLLQGQPGHYQITRKGLGAVGRHYAAPREDLGSYKHDVGLAWLWLAARQGTFGSMRDVLSERSMRSQDGRGGGEPEPFGVRLWGHAPRRLHYADLLLITPDGRRIAIELELTTKSRTRRESILSAYGGDRRIDAVVYLVDRPEVGAAISRTARQIGISAKVHVQRVQWGSTGTMRGGREAERAGTRGAARRERAPTREAAGRVRAGPPEAAGRARAPERER
jgi:hypothetical protein